MKHFPSTWSNLSTNIKLKWFDGMFLVAVQIVAGKMSHADASCLLYTHTHKILTELIVIYIDRCYHIILSPKNHPHLFLQPFEKLCSLIKAMTLPKIYEIHGIYRHSLYSCYSCKTIYFNVIYTKCF